MQRDPMTAYPGPIYRRCAGYSGCEIVLAPTSSCNLAGNCWQREPTGCRNETAAQAQRERGAGMA